MNVYPDSFAILKSKMFFVKNFKNPDCSLHSECVVENWDEVEEDWGDPVYHHTLSLPLSCVHMVQTRDEYLRCIEHVTRDGIEVGFDCEWRPMFVIQQKNAM